MVRAPGALRDAQQHCQQDTPLLRSAIWLTPKRGNPRTWRALSLKDGKAQV